MGILDEAIREHLELKRQHGAADSELQQLEDEAFGQAERPGDEGGSETMAEAPTEFMEQPDAPAEPAARREPSIADLQEPPPPPEPEPPAAEEEPAAAAEPEEDEPEEESTYQDAAVEEQPAMEHEIVSDAPAPAEPDDEPEPEPAAAGPTTEERQAIAEQPTELHDIEGELAAEGEVSIKGPAPDDDAEYDDEDDAFWNEERLSDELDRALDGPSEEPDVVAEAEAAESVEVEFEEEEIVYEVEQVEEDEPEAAAAEPAAAEPDDEDVLEETPDFLEESPEDDQLWFEQKPPKDFDFDD